MGIKLVALVTFWIVLVGAMVIAARELLSFTSARGEPAPVKEADESEEESEKEGRQGPDEG